MFNYKKIITWLAHFTHIQLFLTLISLPILVSWGLPLSIAAPLGNLIFLPFLTAFLLISAIIFFLELLYIPNTWCIYLLELITQWWMYLIKYGSTAWLISFVKPPWFILLVVPLCALAVLLNKKINTLTKSIRALFLLLFFVGCCLKSTAHFCADHITQLPCNNGMITIASLDNKLTLIDPGILGQRVATPTWIEYTLLPFLNKEFGTTTLENIIIMQPNSVTFDCVITLAKLCTLKNVYLVTWQGTAEKTFLRKYGILKYMLEKNNGTLRRYNVKKHEIFYTSSSIAINPLEAHIAYKDIHFPAAQVVLHTKHKTLEIYTAKWQK